MLQSDVGRRWDEFSPWEDSIAAQRQAALAAACRASRLPAYRDVWRGCGIDPAALAAEKTLSAEDWQRLPLLSRELLIEGARQALPFGGRLGVTLAELAHGFVAPGPFYMPFTAADLTHLAASFAKALSCTCAMTCSSSFSRRVVTSRRRRRPAARWSWW